MAMPDGQKMMQQTQMPVCPSDRRSRQLYWLVWQGRRSKGQVQRLCCFARCELFHTQRCHHFGATQILAMVAVCG